MRLAPGGVLWAVSQAVSAGSSIPWRAVWCALQTNTVYAARHRHLTTREHNKLTPYPGTDRHRRRDPAALHEVITDRRAVDCWRLWTASALAGGPTRTQPVPRRSGHPSPSEDLGRSLWASQGGRVAVDVLHSGAPARRHERAHAGTSPESLPGPTGIWKQQSPRRSRLRRNGARRPKSSRDLGEVLIPRVRGIPLNQPGRRG
jgi:hypothetical protein